MAFVSIQSMLVFASLSISQTEAVAFRCHTSGFAENAESRRALATRSLSDGWSGKKHGAVADLKPHSHRVSNVCSTLDDVQMDLYEDTNEKIQKKGYGKDRRSLERALIHYTLYRRPVLVKKVCNT